MKTLILYGSTTGNTENLATILKEYLTTQGQDADLKEVTETNGELINAYDLFLFGCSTWGEGELQEDFEEFYEEMDTMDFNGRLCAVFGPGDEENYPDTFCAAVGIIEEKVTQMGGNLVCEGLKIDENDGDEEKSIRIWADRVLDETRDQAGESQ